MKNVLAVTLATLALTAHSGAYAAMRMAPPAQVGVTDHAPLPMQAGTLSCTIHPGVDRHATCVFEHQAGANSFSETYDTKLTRSLTEDAAKTGQSLHWAVFTPGGKANPGMLLGARPAASVEQTAAGSARVEASFVNDGQRISFRPIDGSTGATSKTALELTPSSASVVLPSKKSLELTVMQ